jgi:hypothetical protein
MSKIQISGRVQHMPGPWGAAVAARNAGVEVIDVDPGGSDDVIWSGATDSQGSFAGTSQEWQDMRSVRVWVQTSVIPPRGHWEDRSVPDPGDVLLLKLRIRQDGRTHDVFPFANGAALPVVLPWGPKDYVAREARALLVLNNTVDQGRANLRALYQFLEASGDAVARSICGPHYQAVRSLNGSAATLDGFCQALKDLAGASGIKAVDAIVNMHGSPGVLWFAGAASGVDMATLRNRLMALGLAGKLRLLYNTSCYGASHAPAFCDGGFNAVIGARKVVCNSASEYPLLLKGWTSGVGLCAALAPAQAAPLREPMDQYAREHRDFPDADSFKTIKGDEALAIGSPAG